MVKALEALLGVNESRTPNIVQDWYNRKFGNLGGNWPWCDGTVTYAAWHSGNEQSVVFGTGYAYTVAHAQKFQSRGQWHVDVAGIARGDIVFFDWGGSNSIGNIDHVGTVTGVQGGNVLCIEGNIDNMCKRTVRQSNYIVGYGRPAYSGGNPAPTPPPTTPPPDSSPLPWVYAGQLNHAAAWDPPAENGHRSYCWPQVMLVEQCLQREGLLTAGLVDGSWGTSTIRAYSKWQNRCGYYGDAANGLPGVASLQKMADKYGTFRVGA